MAKEPVSKIGGLNSPCGFESHRLRQIYTQKKAAGRLSSRPFFLVGLLLCIASIHGWSFSIKDGQTLYQQHGWVFAQDLVEIIGDIAVGSPIHVEEITILPIFSVRTMIYELPHGVEGTSAVFILAFEATPSVAIVFQDGQYRILQISPPGDAFGWDMLPRLMQIAQSHMNADPSRVASSRESAVSQQDLAVISFFTKLIQDK